MSLYHIQEAIFDVPDSFRDKTTNVFAPIKSGANDLSLVVVREIAKPGLTLLRYSERLVMEMEERLLSFELVKRSETEISSRPAVVFDYYWVSNGTRIFQRQITFLLDSEAKESPLGLLVTFTAREWTPQWQSVYQDFVKSFQLRRNV